MDALEFGVIHSLRKIAHTSEAEVRLSERVLDVSNEAVLNLATQLADLVGKSGSRVMWGQFSDDNRQGLFPGTVKDFSSELTQEKFMSSSLIAMKELLNQAKEEPLSTGGHICFFAFRSRQKPFLLVAMVKERSGLTLSEDLVPTSIVEIDLSKLHQAARINLQTYLEQTSEQRGSVHGDINSSEPEAEVEVEVEEERAYLCFVDKGVGRSTVAGYFIRALGCERGVSSERATKAVIRAVRNFVKGNAEISSSAPYVRHKLIDYFSTKDDGSAITLEAVAEVVRGALGPDKAFHADGLVDHLNSDEMRIPVEFPLSRKAVRDVTRIKVRESRYSIEVENSALGTENSEVVYDYQSRSLTFTRLPENFVAEIEKTLNDRRPPR